jgi:hypothetical protein
MEDIVKVERPHANRTSPEIRIMNPTTATLLSFKKNKITVVLV